MLANLLIPDSLVIMLTGALVGIAGTLVGTFLVLTGRSMLSDAISHSIILGIAVVWLLTGQQSGPLQMAGAAVSGLLTVLVTQALVRTRRMRNDAAIGLVFPVFFALGVLLLNIYARDVHIDEHTVLTGAMEFVPFATTEIAGVNVPRSVLAMLIITPINLAFVVFFYKELKLATFDPMLARALGFAPAVLSYGLLLLTSITAVAAFEAVGVILFVAFVIVPPSAAYLLTDRLWLMLVIGCGIAVAASLSGFVVTLYYPDANIGATMAVMTGVFLVAAFLFSPRNGLIRQWWRRRSQRAEAAAQSATKPATTPETDG